MKSIPLFLTVLIVAVAPVVLIRSLAAMVSTFLSFHLDLLRSCCGILIILMFSVIITLRLVDSRLRILLSFDLHFDF